MLKQVIEHAISALTSPSDTTSLSTSSLQAPKYPCELILPQACPLRGKAWGECASFGWRSHVSAHGMHGLLRMSEPQ